MIVSLIRGIRPNRGPSSLRRTDVYADFGLFRSTVSGPSVTASSSRYQASRVTLFARSHVRFDVPLAESRIDRARKCRDSEWPHAVTIARSSPPGQPCNRSVNRKIASQVDQLMVFGPFPARVDAHEYVVRETWIVLDTDRFGPLDSILVPAGEHDR